MEEHKTYTCNLCGAAHRREELISFDGRLLCEDCLDRETVRCTECGRLIWRQDNAGDTDTPLCQECCGRFYLPCEGCRVPIRRGTEHCLAYCHGHVTPYCQACHMTRSRENAAIHDYFYKPAAIFHGKGPRYFGVELELDDGGEDEDNARALLSIADRAKEYLYIKHDGSLQEGMELVTHPLSLYIHQHRMPWKEVCRKALDLGYHSHRPGTCGLHVHISRRAFGKTAEEQDACIARVLYFVEKNWEELLKFSRRTPRQLDRWAARYGLKDQPAEILDQAKKGHDRGRYACVNLENSKTIEFRLFRGTLKYNTLIATLQMVDRICDVALYLTDEEIKAMSWTSFAAGCTQPELVRYLKERRLYVNEPVTDLEVEP